VKDNGMSSAPKLHLGLFNQPLGRHVAGWRQPEFKGSSTDIRWVAELASLAERGKFDFYFLADSLVGPAPGSTKRAGNLEPLTVLSALSVTTSRIGLAGTATTTFSEPYNLARQFASLDHISGGRAAWNVVTSTWNAAAGNFGADKLPDHAARYERAREFVKVVKGLWDSWDDGAVIADKESGHYIDPARIRQLGHDGAHFSVAGALNVPRPPQGHPIIIQAGASDDGRDLAAETADVIFSAQDNIEDSRKFTADLRQRASAKGRSVPPFVMPGVLPIVARTRAEAEDIYAGLEEKTDITEGLDQLSQRWGFDLSAYPLDEPPPAPVFSGNLFSDGYSRRVLLEERARREGLTLRQLARVAIASRGHRLFVGSAKELADDFEAWFTTGAADGFNIIPPYLPGSLHAFVDLVVPELQRRGLFRQDYTGTTLREHLGLERPARR
jgi:FMN-dependent oxidoreductase (nitrilotriacetate monooxygenase family)